MQPIQRSVPSRSRHLHAFYQRFRNGHPAFLLRLFLSAIACFTIFRIVLLVTNIRSLQHQGIAGCIIVAKAFWMGFRFDTVISCYLLSIPIITFSFCFLAGVVSENLLRMLYGWAAIFFTAAFLLCAVDIPFFHHFFNRLDNTVFNWSNHSEFGIKMVLQEPGFLMYLLLFVMAASLYLFLLKRIAGRHIAHVVSSAKSKRSQLVYTPAVLLVWGFTFLGIRGRTSPKTPIIPGTAFFSDDPLANEMGLNPVFTLMRSMLDDLQPGNQRLHWIPDEEAIASMHRDIVGDSMDSSAPIARKMLPAADLKGRNVVLVIMESMSSAKMRRYGNNENLTPFLDSLANNAWSFDNIFSAGIHTYNGIYSTLFAHPALMKKHSMDQVNVPQMQGLPQTLRAQGYSTLFFTTHDELFDNMSGFLSANGMERIVGQKDYPSKEIRSTLGVPDEFMFRYAVPVLNELSAKKKPFFAAFMTGSDHDPFIIPGDVGFHGRHEEPVKQIVEYADWSLKRFMEYAALQDWYGNTVFVFVADHGCNMGVNRYDVEFSYHHIPFVVFAPGYTKPVSIDRLGLQTDVFATIMGLVGDPYINNTFSFDLLQERHPYIVFSADSKLACMNDSLLYVFRVNANQSLYRYRNDDVHDYFDTDSMKALPMRQHAFSWLQTSQWMIEHKLSGPQ